MYVVCVHVGVSGLCVGECERVWVYVVDVHVVVSGYGCMACVACGCGCGVCGVWRVWRVGVCVGVVYGVCVCAGV